MRRARVFTKLLRAIDDAVTREIPDWLVIGKVSIRFGGGFQPIPDIVVCERALVDFSLEAPLPGAAVRLVVEVAASSLADDLGSKLAEYAGVGLPEYWVVDVRGGALFQHAGPIVSEEGATLATRRTVPLAGALQALTMPLTIAAGALDV